MSFDVQGLDGRTSAAMRAILDLEDDAPDELLEVLPGGTVPFWAQVRIQISWALSAEENGSVEVARVSTWNRWSEAKRVARGYLPSRWDAVRRARHHELCFYVAGGTLVRDGARVRNWLVDDFADASEDGIVVQLRPLPSSMGRPMFRPTMSMEASVARSRWRARGKGPAPEFTRSADRLLAAFARRLNQPPEAFAAIGKRAVVNEALRPFLLEELQRMLERMKPKIVVYDNGSYTYNGESIGLMKDHGAYVVEPQHGWIGPSHAAYNYGRIFADPSLRRALPDELLTFGSYWSNSIRHPGKTTVIGKPHLERQAASVPSMRPRQLLVVSSRTEPQRTDAFVVGLRAAVGSEWSVVFRPHPGELAETEERYPLLAADAGVLIDRAPDVYESLKQSAVVIGEASTVLFEARAFGCCVIARDSSFAENVIGDVFGDRVRDVAETVRRLERLRGDETVAASADPTIWAPGSVDSFSNWLSQRLGVEALR